MDIFGFFGWICSLLVLSCIVAKIRCLWQRVAAHDHGGSSHPLQMATRGSPRPCQKHIRRNQKMKFQKIEFV
ncbi:hypothetical protein I3842_10G057100 [Carya illinoinensis]|uniref:Uncharacterized protein n=1 Tax=Carya illinoinensis TaxID=32201 RepID=A0A922DVF3_CARIL|nr:hypothetical protein I3842_10G057100 [Carya illinoinensis]